MRCVVILTKNLFELEWGYINCYNITLRRNAYGINKNTELPGK